MEVLTELTTKKYSLPKRFTIAPVRDEQVVPICIGKKDFKHLGLDPEINEEVGKSRQRKGWSRTANFYSDGVRVSVSFKRPRGVEDQLRLKEVRRNKKDGSSPGKPLFFLNSGSNCIFCLSKLNL